MSLSFFDIETGPLPDDQLARVKPEFKPPSNYKDEDKIKAYLAEAEIKWKQDCALSAVTGQVLMIGVRDAGGSDIITGDEPEVLNRFWTWAGKLVLGHSVAGYAIFHFDLPFLVQRSYVNRVSVPMDVRKGRYWSEHFIDLAEVWSCGNRDKVISLDTLAKTLGLPGKTGNGKAFAGLFATDPQKAADYCLRDLELCQQIADILWINK